MIRVSGKLGCALAGLFDVERFTGARGTLTAVPKHKCTGRVAALTQMAKLLRDEPGNIVSSRLNQSAECELEISEESEMESAQTLAVGLAQVLECPIPVLYDGALLAYFHAKDAKNAAD